MPSTLAILRRPTASHPPLPGVAGLRRPRTRATRRRTHFAKLGRASQSQIARPPSSPPHSPRIRTRASRFRPRPAPARSRSRSKHSASAPATRSSSPQSLSPRPLTLRSHAWRVPFSPTSAPPTHASIPNPCKRLITRRTKAIIPVHYGASLADLDALAEISRAHSIPIVEDCAHVPGAQFRDRGVGTHGALGCFSFQSSKPMTAGEGGMITTNDPDLEQRCQSLINCGRRRPDDKFEGPLMGANYRMTEWQCGILLAQLARLPEQIEHKSRAAARLREGLGRNQGTEPDRSRSTRHSRRRSTRSFFWSMNPRSACRAIASSARCAPKASHAASPTSPSIARALFPRESAAYRKACELAGANPDSSRDRLPGRRTDLRARDGLDTARMPARRRPRPRRHRRRGRQSGFQSRRARHSAKLQMSPLYAGCRARESSNRPLGLAMLGYGNRVGRNAGVHDDLAAQAIVLSDGANKIAIAGVDVLALGSASPTTSASASPRSPTSAPTRSWSAQRTPIPRPPSTSSRLRAPTRSQPRAADLEWERALPEKIANAIIQRQRKTRTRDAPRCRRAVHARNQSPPDASARTDSDRRKSSGRGRRRSRRPRRIHRADGIRSRFYSTIRATASCCARTTCSTRAIGPALRWTKSKARPRSPAARSQSRSFIQGATGNIDPRSRGNFEVAEQQRPHDGPCCVRRASACALARRRAHRRPPNPARLELKDLDADARDRARLRRPDPGFAATTIAAATAIN